jgi:hypothetical protein
MFAFAIMVLQFPTPTVPYTEPTNVSLVMLEFLTSVLDTTYLLVLDLTVILTSVFALWVSHELTVKFIKLLNVTPAVLLDTPTTLQLPNAILTSATATMVSNMDQSAKTNVKITVPKIAEFAPVTTILKAMNIRAHDGSAILATIMKINLLVKKMSVFVLMVLL